MSALRHFHIYLLPKQCAQSRHNKCIYINIYYIYRYAIYAVQSDVFIHTHKCVFDFDAAENENKREARRRDETLTTVPKIHFIRYIYRYTHSIYISNCTGSGAKWEALTHLRQEAPVQFHVICNCCDASTWALGGLHSPTKEGQRGGQERGWGVVYAIALLPYSWETFT